MTNICFFSGSMHLGGGTQHMVQLLANQLSKNPKYNVYVLSKCDHGLQPFYDLDPAIKYSALDNGKYIKGISVLRDIGLLAKYVRKNHIDILINVDVSLGAFSLPLLFFQPKLKQVFWEHFSTAYDSGNARMEKYRALALKYGTAFVTLTQQDADDLKTRYSKVKKLVAIPNICERQGAAYSYNIHSKTIVSVGNTIPVKGFDMAVSAAENIFHAHPDWQWHIYGDGSQLSELQSLVEEKQLQDFVKFKGRVHDLEEAYSEASMLVMTSRSEGFGLVLAEAQAHHLPTIAFDVPYGPRNLIHHGKNGFLVKPFEINELSDRIMELIETPELRKTFSENAAVSLPKYSPGIVAEQWMQLLEAL